MKNDGVFDCRKSNSLTWHGSRCSFTLLLPATSTLYIDRTSPTSMVKGQWDSKLMGKKTKDNQQERYAQTTRLKAGCTEISLNSPLSALPPELHRP